MKHRIVQLNEGSEKWASKTVEKRPHAKPAPQKVVKPTDKDNS
jgi:hypothetical protein